MGSENVSSGSSVAVGHYNSLSGNIAFAYGRSNTISGDESTAIGSEHNVTGAYALAGGFANAAFGDYATVLGFGSSAHGWRSFSAGVMTGANGELSVAIGVGAVALQNGQTVIGRYNDTALDADAAFVIGNGYATEGTPVSRNALIIRTNNDTEAKGNLHSAKTTGYNKFKAPILVPESGDISMGEFTAGEQP